MLVEEKDVKGLAEAIDRVYASPELRKEMGIENRRLAELHFSPDNVKKTTTVARRLCPASCSK